MLETGGILIVMGVIFFLGAAGEGILSLFYLRYLRDTADMGRPGKKLVKLTKLRYETSYYLNGTVHNAKTMVDSMLEHYRLAGLRLWTWHHMATAAAFLCGVMGFVIGGAYVVGRYVPAVKSCFPLSGMNALIYTLAGEALAAMLLFWQNLLDNRTKRRRIESNLVDYFDNEKFHQLGREIALSGRVREITGDRGRREDPGSSGAEEAETGRAQSAATVMQEETEEMDGADETDGMNGMDETGGMNGMNEMNEMDGRSGVPDAATEDGEFSNSKNGKKKVSASAKAQVKKSARVVTIGDIIAQGEPSDDAEPEAGGTARGRNGARKKTTATSTRARAKTVQIAQEEMEERRSGSSRRQEEPEEGRTVNRKKEGPEEGRTTGRRQEEPEEAWAVDLEKEESEEGRTVSRKKEEPEEGRTAALKKGASEGPKKAAVRRKNRTEQKVIIPMNPEMEAAESSEEAEVSGKLAKMEAAATATSANTAREEELLRLLREYMGL